RVHSGNARFIAMDAPPQRENSEPFVRISRWLADLGMNSPRVLAEGIAKGFLLLTDLGERQYLQVLREQPQRAHELYDDALRALDVLQHTGTRYQSQLPSYNSALLNDELGLFRDWLCGTHLQLRFSADDATRWRDTCDFLVESALAQPRVFVHRDYHSRNLIVCDDDNPGILDFQDAVNGPLTYDLVSLLKDCYIRWPDADVEALARGFYARACRRLPSGFNELAFMRAFELMGVHRHLKAAGIFARLNHRDGKPAYLADIPRTLTYVSDVARRYEELGFLSALLRERCLPALQAAA
ncbi:MAG: phosphotransferase, partial [Halioglobus sp.]|nr:phosphotransferase [Halioglobus sp.]